MNTTSYKGRKTNPNGVHLTPASILLVGCDESNHRHIKDSLQQLSLIIKETKDGPEAIRSAHEDRIDLVLMDITSPEMDRIETAEKIKQINLPHQIPIVAVTTEDFTHAEIEKHRVFDGYLYKPFSSERLIGELRKFLDHQFIESLDQLPTKRQSQLDKNDPDSKIIDSDILIKQLTLEIDTGWKEVCESMMLNDVEAFAERMKELGTEHRFSTLEMWADQLLEYVKIMEPAYMEQSIAGFPGIIDYLKKIRTDKSP